MNFKTHNAEVSKVVDGVIQLMNKKFAASGIFTVAGLLELCRGHVVTQLRESGKPGASENEVFRDAEYYFIGRSEVAEESNDVMRFIERHRWVMLNQGYNAAKAIANFFKSEVMRSDPDKPTSPPGGVEWLKAGIKDAGSDRGSDYSEIPPRRSVAEYEGAR